MALPPYRFLEWIAFFENVDLPIGDLAQDIKRDKNFPDTQDPVKIEDHLRSTHATREAVQAFRDVWKFYMKTR